MKSKFLILIFLFSIFSNIWSDSQSENRAFLLNTNGIAVYKSKDLTSKMGTIEKGEEFLLRGLDSNEKWLPIESKRYKGFILNSKFLSSEIMTFTNPLQKTYLVLKKKRVSLQEKPFSDAKVLGELEQFSLLEILSICNSIEKTKEEKDQRWYEIKTKNNKTGYVKDVAIYYDTLEKANSIVEKKQIDLSGYALVTNPVYLSSPSGDKKEDQINQNRFSKKGEFIRVIESQEKNGIKYFYFSMGNPARSYKMEATPKDFDDSPIEGWISEKDVKYFSPNEFSRYSLKNSKYNGDLLLLEKIFAQNQNLPLNFLNAYENPLTNKKGKENPIYSIVSLYSGYVNSAGYGDIVPASFLVKREKDGYTAYSGNISNRGKIKIIDLDKDGTPEIFSTMDTDSLSRVAFSAPVFYGYIDGAYKEIPLPGNFLDNYTLDENFLYLDERKDSSKKPMKKKYKYLNGKFEEVKN